MEFLTMLLPFLPIVVTIVIVCVVLALCVKVVSGNEILVVTGIGATKKTPRTVKVMRDGVEEEEVQIAYVPKIKIAGACVVVPFLQKARKFDVCVETFTKIGDTIKTVSGVEIDIDWGISYAPNAETVESVQPAVRQFLDKSKDEVRTILDNAVAGGVRAVVSTMTPEEVMVGKEKLDDQVQKVISAQMAELGYKVQLYIQEVRDSVGSTYLYDVAAKDREETRRTAANITAMANQDIREKSAAAERIAKEAELDSDVAIAAKGRDTAVQKAQFKAETDKAEADAEIAGQLQMTERQKELAVREGEVVVTKQEQANLAAEKEQAVKVTQAETAKKEKVILSQADSEKKKIEAEAAAAVAVKEAEGKATAAKTAASGEAEAVKVRAEADAEKIRMTGEADAKAISAKGLAEAQAIEAKGLAEAKAEKALADARAANDKVNFEIQKLEIERNAEIQVATSVATVMAKVGENAKFYDFGGKSGESGNLLTDVLSSLPMLFAKTNLQNNALNGEDVTETLNKVINSVVSPLSALAEKKEKETRIIVGDDDIPVTEDPGDNDSE